MPNDDPPALRAAIAAVGATMAALGQPPSSIRTAGDLHRWVAGWMQTRDLTDPDEPIVITAAAQPTIERFEVAPDDVDQLAKVWTDSLGQVARRLEVIEDPEAPGVALGLAGDPMVATRSVWSRRSSRKKPVLWRWPIDIAALSAAGGGAIREEVSSLLISKHYLEPLIKFTGEDRALAADVLLLRGTPDEILRATLPKARAPKAGLVLVQSDLPVESQGVAHAIHVLGRRFPGSAVAWASVPNSRFQWWLEELIRQLSHNEPLDVAMFKASEQGHPGRPPIIIAPPGSMERARLSRSIDRLERRLRSAAVRAKPMAIPPGGRAEAVLATSGEVTAGEVGELLRRVPRDVGFASESGLATASVELSAAAPPAMAHRFLQARVMSKNDDGGETRTTWVLGEINVVEARVGVEAPEWPTPRGAKPFPLEEVLADEEEATVDVFCYVSGVLDKPLKRQMTVRRTRDSSVVRFEIKVTEFTETLTARVVVMHGGRILQAGTLAGKVRRSHNESVAPAEFTLEALIRSNIAGLRGLQRLDGSLLVMPGSTEFFDGIKGFKAPPILPALLKDYDVKLSDVGKHPEMYADLETDASLTLIRALARVGFLVRDQLEEAGLSGNILQGKRLQVISTTSSVRVPMELFYDGLAPLPNATLCPNWKVGLMRGECAVDCPADQGGNAHICPRRFWGLSRVIERHIESGSNPEWTGDFAIRAEPDDRTDLRLFRASAVAGSNRVTRHAPNGLSELRAQLEQHDGVPAHHRLAGNWTDWQKAIREGSPSLLLLLPHTKMQGREPELEIGGDPRLLSNIEDLDNGQPDRKPVVVLLGCETDTDPTEFFDVVGYCRRRGAVIVIAFSATIAVAHAVPAAKELLQQLTVAINSTPSAVLGDVMLATRRALVATGWIAALGLTAYGDADWKLVN